MARNIEFRFWPAEGGKVRVVGVDETDGVRSELDGELSPGDVLYGIPYSEYEEAGYGYAVNLESSEVIRFAVSASDQEMFEEAMALRREVLLAEAAAEAAHQGPGHVELD